MTYAVGSMEEPGPPIPPRRVPWVTAVACVLCGAVFLLASLGYERYVRPLHGSSWDVRQGRWWIAVTACFVHHDWWHVLGNVYMLWPLGRVLEETLGAARYAAFLLITAAVSSALELALSEGGGFGMSGVVYGVFGFLWVARGRYPAFAAVLTTHVVRVVIAWFFLCIAVTWLGIWRVGNVAHGAGCLVGALAALVHLRSLRRLAVAGLLVLAAAGGVGLVWAPWSGTWLVEQGQEAGKRKDYDEARALFERGLERGADPVWVWDNLCYLHAERGDPAAFEEAVRNLHRLDRDRAAEVEGRYTARLGHALMLQERYGEAVPAFRRALALGADPAWIWECLAYIHHRTGDPEARRRALEELRRHAPDRARELEGG